MTDAELNEIEARANAATPGPWRQGAVDKIRIFGDPDNPEAVAPGLGRCVALLSQWVAPERRDADATFIAAAREDVPALVAEVRRLRAIEEAARRVAKWDVGHHEDCGRSQCGGDCDDCDTYCGSAGLDCGCTEHECAGVGVCATADVAALRDALDAAKEKP